MLFSITGRIQEFLKLLVKFLGHTVPRIRLRFSVDLRYENEVCSGRLKRQAGDARTLPWVQVSIGIPSHNTGPEVVVAGLGKEASDRNSHCLGHSVVV